MDRSRVPRTPEEVAALEAAYQPFDSAAAWSGVPCDVARWQRHAEALTAAVQRADASAWAQLRERFLRAAALDSAALAELIHPVPELTTVVLRSSLSDGDWISVVEANRLVVECHRRALVVASDAAQDGRPIDENLIARLQDLIVESQQSYTVSTSDGRRIEVELPRRQYKPVSNYTMSETQGLVPFAPAARVPDEMRRLTSELASEAFGAMHPVVQSAYTHLALSRIHPFADGNGRLCRTVASMPLLREVGLPQLILADQWPAYLQAVGKGDQGDVGPLVELFLAAQVNTMALARDLLEVGIAGEIAAPVVEPGSAERTLLDLVLVHLRAALGVPQGSSRVSVTRPSADRLGVARVDAVGNHDLATDFIVESNAADGWLRVTSSAGDVFEVSRNDVHPAPLEIVHLRARAWLDCILSKGGVGSRASHVRGLFVLGVPRSGTTVMGNYLGSHPDVLGLAEYGGFYVAHSVAPAYINRLPGREHEQFLAALADLAADHVSVVARERDCSWYCDATPWNLQIAGALARSLPDAIFVLMLRHFSGAILSLRQFGWAGESWEDAAKLWASLNACIAQVPSDRTLVISYDALAEQPAGTLAAIHEALNSLGLDPGGFDARQFTASHAALIGKPRPTIAQLVDGHLVWRAISSLDQDRWTPDVHARVWPHVKDTHRALGGQFADVYVSPPRPHHVAESEW